VQDPTLVIHSVCTKDSQTVFFASTIYDSPICLYWSCTMHLHLAVERTRSLGLNMSESCCTHLTQIVIVRHHAGDIPSCWPILALTHALVANATPWPHW
jgi:hypothetical protein